MAERVRDISEISAIPLFPLPDVVLFPRAVLPLHIFEPRYRQMTADVLRGHRQIAMALLKEGWEKDYHGSPAIEPVVCVGTILSHEMVEDGKYNFLLQGHTRARIVHEHAHRPYRLAKLEPLPQTEPSEDDLRPARQRLIDIFDSGTLLATVIGRQFRQLLAGSLSTPDVADLIAFNFLPDTSVKHALLCEGDVRKRVERTIAAFESARPPMSPPPAYPGKPSLN